MACVEKPLFTIFLDFDGVLYSWNIRDRVSAGPSTGAQEYVKTIENFVQQAEVPNDRWWDVVHAWHFSKIALGHLDDLICRVAKVAQPQIVISSRWRIGCSVEDLKTIFGMHNFAGYIVDKTLDHLFLDRIASTSDEIQDWLDRHPAVKHYVVFDDCDLGNSFEKRFVRIDPVNLLSATDVKAALAADALTASLYEPELSPQKENSPIQVEETVGKVLKQFFKRALWQVVSVIKLLMNFFRNFLLSK